MVKQALIAAVNDDKYLTLKKATCGLVFFAVPHKDGYKADLNTVAKNIVSSMTGNAKNDTIGSLKSNSLFLETLATSFQDQLEEIEF